MELKSKVFKFSYKILINVLVNYFFMMLIIETLRVEKNLLISSIIVGTSIISVCFWRLIFKKPLSILIIMILGTATIAFMNYYHAETYWQIIEEINDFIVWSNRYIYGMTFLHDKLMKILLGVMVFVLSLITSIFIFRKKGDAILLVLGTIVFMVRWFQYSDIAIIYGILFILVMLMLHTFNRYLEKEALWQKDGKGIKRNILRNWIIYSTLICLVVVSISAALPRNYSPVTWRWLDKKLQGNFSYFADWRNARKTSFGYGKKMKFDLSLTGFQEDYKRLGGPVNQDETLVMVVDSDEPVYLKGRVKDYYTGSFWKSTGTSYSEELKGIPNSLYENNKFSPDGEEIEGQQIQYTVTHKDIITSSLFNSYFPKTFNLDESFYYITDEWETFGKNLILKDNSYTFFGVKPYVDMAKITKSNYKHREEFDKYLQLPETTTNRVDELAYKITRGVKSDYSKVKMIEQYLRLNYEYTLTPPETPHNQDFVDYFLFDLKEGYCTYFASSLVVMARSAGIPARYVEGFKASYENRNDDGDFLIYGSNAHAWAEVFIEGYGWMLFEATPPFRDVDYDEKVKEEEAEKEIEANGGPNPIEREMRELEDPSMMEEIVEGGEFNFDDTKESSGLILKIMGYMILLALAVFLLVILFNLYRIGKINNKLRKKSLRDRVLDYYSYIMNMLDRIDKGKEENETVTEYSSRLNLDVWEVGHKFEKTTDIFNKARYSSEDITEEEVEELREYYLKTEETVRNKIGLVRFLIFKFLVMGIYKE